MTTLQKMGGERVPEGMTSNVFVNPGFACGLFDRSLQSRGFEVVTPYDARRARVRGIVGGRKEILPAQFRGGVRILHCEGMGKVNLSEASRQIFIVKEANALDLSLQVRDERVGQGCDAVFFSFAIPNSVRRGWREGTAASQRARF